MARVSKYSKAVAAEAARHAKAGMKNNQIAKAIGITPSTFTTWCNRFPDFKNTLIRARKQGKLKRSRQVAKTTNVSVATFNEYVYRHLDPEVQEYWNRLKAFDNSPSGLAKAEALLEKGGKYIRQNIFVHAWISSGFKFAVACRRANVSRSVYETWKSKDEKFQQLISDISFYKSQFFEEALIDLVAMRSESSVIFANRTYNKDVYGENKKVELSGSIGTENKVDLSQLSLEARKEILKQIRGKDDDSQSL